MTIESETLIRDLIERTRLNINHAEKFKLLTIDRLDFRNGDNSWSILECFEHLNLYGDFYIQEIETKINSSKTLPTTNFKSGVIGNYFAKSMQPKKNLKKMRTFKNKNPIRRTLNKKTIERFILQQERILDLLDKSRNINLNKTKTAISISKLIKLKLGDTFRVVIYHNERHIVQANNIFAGKASR